mgnify:FL=1
MTIVLCSKGYPGKYSINKTIKNLEKVKLFKNDFIYHAGTKAYAGQILSAGGRVLNITSVGKKFINIRKRILKIIKKINWKHGFHRKDIARRVINKKWE